MTTKPKTRKAAGQNAALDSIEVSEKRTRKPLAAEQIRLGEFEDELDEISSLSMAAELAIRGKPAHETEFNALHVLMIHVNRRLMDLLGKIKNEDAEADAA
jgi:hypothetical protein